MASKIDKDTSIMTQRLFRNPHQTISFVAIVGGGNHPKPEKLSLSHNWMLFPDELPEFKRTVLEVMYQMFEDRVRLGG